MNLVTEIATKGLLLDRVRIRLGTNCLINLTTIVEPGTVTTVMGSSGSGKSTLLAFIGGFLNPAFKAEGRVLLDGTDITGLQPQARHTGILFQDPLLFPHLSVADNLLFALTPSLKGKRHRRQAVSKALADIGLDGFGTRDPATLSGGQQARVALLRVLLAQPKALLLDEPFSKLDTDRRDQMRQLVFSAAKARHLPVLLVTHDGADAKAAGGPVVIL